MNKQAKKLYAGLIVFTLFVAALDQLSKYLVVKTIPLYGVVPLLPKVVHLTHVQNEGAAFSLFAGMRWVFVGMVLVFLAAVIVFIAKKVFSRPFELWCLAAIAGGAIGNGIDRVISGKVTDMIAVDFISFPVFNVADCFITCGAIALAVYLLFFQKNAKETTS